MKKCIFCNNNIKNKSKEHILPLWLIKLTGNEKRVINFGINYNNVNLKKEPYNIRFSFDSFTYPACALCNNNYGKDLEAPSKIIIEKILEGENLNGIELNTLLDWFDKVRIGLWIGLNKLVKFYPVEEKFGTDKRIGAKDRLLIIYKFPYIGQGITFYGVDSPLFIYMPSCFCLRINNYFFLNISTDDILSKSLGYPFFREILFLDDTRKQYSNINMGSETIDEVQLNTFMSPKYHKAIFQPIFKHYPKEIYNFTSEFLKQNPIKRNGKGSIFVKSEDQIKNIHLLDNIYNLSGDFIDEENVRDYIKEIINATYTNLELLWDIQLKLNYESESFKQKHIAMISQYREINIWLRKGHIANIK